MIGHLDDNRGVLGLRGGQGGGLRAVLKVSWYMVFLRWNFHDSFCAECDGRLPKPVWREEAVVRPAAVATRQLTILAPRGIGRNP